MKMGKQDTPPPRPDGRGPPPRQAGRCKRKRPQRYRTSPLVGEGDHLRSKWWWGFLLSFLLLPTFAHADTPEQTARAQHLYSEIRCLVCQGESIADSDASIASDLRTEIRADIAKGMSDAQIRKSLYDRYGDYVLFRPRLSKLNLILWLLPPLVVIGGIAFFFLRARKPKISRDYELTEAEREKLDDALKE